MSRKKKAPKFVPPPEPTVPAWLLTCEARAKAHGLNAERCKPYAYGGGDWWLSVSPPKVGFGAPNCKISIFGARQYILDAQVQNLAPRDLVTWAEMCVEMAAHVIPEAFAKEAA